MPRLGDSRHMEMSATIQQSIPTPSQRFIVTLVSMQVFKPIISMIITISVILRVGRFLGQFKKRQKSDAAKLTASHAGVRKIKF